LGSAKGLLPTHVDRAGAYCSATEPKSRHLPAGLPVPPNFLAQYAVMASYEHAMLMVQSFERGLASVVMLAELAEVIRTRDMSKRLSWKSYPDFVCAWRRLMR
jgi:hypothetical protein